jgi:hypothetical protein
MHAITIRFSDEQFDRINETRGDRAISEFCREVLGGALENRTGSQGGSLQADLVDQLRAENEYLRKELSRAQELTSQAQAVSLSLTKQLPGGVEKAKRH